MIDHVSYAVSDFKKSVEFYDATLEILGYTRLMNINESDHEAAGYGKDNPAFWIGFDKSNRASDEQIGKAKGFHIAIVADSADAIQRWYKKALELGARDNGAPGPRKEYHPGYYAAYIVTPDGWRIEALTQHYQGE